MHNIQIWCDKEYDSEMCVQIKLSESVISIQLQYRGLYCLKVITACACSCFPQWQPSDDQLKYHSRSRLIVRN